MIRVFILKTLLYAQSLFFLGIISPQYITLMGDPSLYLVSGMSFALMHILVMPFLKLISLPFIILTAGLFSFVLNALMVFFLTFVVSILNNGTWVFEIAPSVVAYGIIGFQLAVATWIINWLLKR